MEYKDIKAACLEMAHKNSCSPELALKMLERVLLKLKTIEKKEILEDDATVVKIHPNTVYQYSTHRRK
jgi:hypothetical protein